MSAASRLWHRAPLWRTCVFSILIFTALTLLYPPAYLTRAIPALQPVIDRINRTLGRSTPPPAPAPDAAPSPDAPPDAPPPGQQADGSGAPGAGGPGGTQVAAPPITSDLSGAIPFAGRILPLPAGTWHPVLTTQSGPHGELLSNVLVRAEGGVVTGVIIARGSTQSLPLSTVDAMNNGCHDDRNYLSRVITTDPKVMECWFTGHVQIEGQPLSDSIDIQTAFNRLHVLGFPIPYVMLVATWDYAEIAADHGANIENVTILLSPARKGTMTLPAPPDKWMKQLLPQNPGAERFVHQANDWMEGWTAMLRRGFHGTLSADAPELARAARDPASVMNAD
ncbi:hypothetical protein HLH34_04030 [Gluconacetobacter azotocaptans]|uniref:Uncharacterized protein n=1 Tax=Gluconacetobacter azotocaptans TaxID=142834 RepID=A0A7W4JQM0_9PROT|nr:hypothetical protein [Gluconacetobacter azotocaptans]MBB2189131.1 hypothetical protein [Gluconacetobacter azotocaptans]GBQ26370.1 hypothetical protein AA13594_0222 [Gluconacetobacter azotocaptans DSM 13594]